MPAYDSCCPYTDLRTYGPNYGQCTDKVFPQDGLPVWERNGKIAYNFVCKECPDVNELAIGVGVGGGFQKWKTLTQFIV
jgi:hypothetical protein